MDLLKAKIFKDRITTTDEQGRRVRVIPAAIEGYFQKHKDRVHLALVVFFLVLPWFRINGDPAFLIDVVHRKFYILGYLFLPQDVPGIFFVLGSVVISLLFVSALYGRVWCGWACPQTVFIEGFFRRVERWVEGSHLKQRELDFMPWSKEKIFKRVVKWSLFTLGSLVVTHSFLAYFVGADKVLEMIRHSPLEHPTSFLIVMLTSGFMLFNFGWFREQFCLIACPYGRFQSVMMDEHSVTIAYDTKRGEPRKNSQAADKPVGDCISCNKCVQVCPTGIDIRNGFQMECIACTACADACDFVMRKVGKPEGLIRYVSETELSGGKVSLLRARTVLYGLILIVMLSGLVFRVVNQKEFQTEIIRAIDMPYQVVKDAMGQDYIINHFKLNWYNLTSADAKVNLRLASEDASQFELIQAQTDFSVVSAKKTKHQFFIKFKNSPLGEVKTMVNRKVHLVANWQTPVKSFTEQIEVSLVAP
jgi:cytochrome c oxidase accessory protein FixG